MVQILNKTEINIYKILFRELFLEIIKYYDCSQYSIILSLGNLSEVIPAMLNLTCNFTLQWSSLSFNLGLLSKFQYAFARFLENCQFIEIVRLNCLGICLIGYRRSDFCKYLIDLTLVSLE